MRLKKLVLILILHGVYVHATPPVLGVYFTNWSQFRSGIGAFTPTNLAPIINSVSYVTYAFAFFNYNVYGSGVTGDWEIYFTEYDDATFIADINAYKSGNPNLKVLLSIGGASFTDGTYPTASFFSELMAYGPSSSEGEAFINSALSYCSTYALNGIDIDWEWPGQPSNSGTAQDYNNYALFLAALSSQLHGSGYLLSMAVPAAAPYGFLTGTYNGGTQTVNAANPQSYFDWLAYISQYFDYFNVESYDYYGPYGGETDTDDNSPLYPRIPGNYSVLGTFDSYVQAGVAPSFMLMGVPAYGHTFAGVTFPSPQPYQPFAAGCPWTQAGAAGPYTQEPGTLAYYEILDDLSSGAYTATEINLNTYTSYAYSGAGQTWVSYDSLPTAQIKGRWIKANGLKGGLIWAPDLDNFQTTYDVINGVIAGMSGCG